MVYGSQYNWGGLGLCQVQFLACWHVGMDTLGNMKGLKIGRAFLCEYGVFGGKGTRLRRQ